MNPIRGKATATIGGQPRGRGGRLANLPTRNTVSSMRDPAAVLESRYRDLDVLGTRCTYQKGLVVLWEIQLPDFRYITVAEADAMLAGAKEKKHHLMLLNRAPNRLGRAISSLVGLTDEELRRLEMTQVEYNSFLDQEGP